MSSQANTKELLLERAKTHGNFYRTAEFSQKLKAFLHETDGFAYLCDTQKEALECIMLKIARILSGDANEPDHWDDIAGYAELGRSLKVIVETVKNTAIKYNGRNYEYVPDIDDESSTG